MAEIQTKPTEGKIGIIEAIRGLASLSVCLFHFKENIVTAGLEKFDSSGLLHSFIIIAGFGWLGVEAFFVVSGFIIPYALLKSKYSINRFFNFFSKRCLRIEPPYLVSVILVIVLGYASAHAPGFKGLPFQIDAGNIFAHIGYLPEHLGYSWLQPVYWSLEAEFHYYILIGLLLPVLWKNKIALFLGFILMLLSGFFIPLYVFSYMPFFVLGIATCARKVDFVGNTEYLFVLLAVFFTCILRHQPIEMPIVGIATCLAINYIKVQHSLFNFFGKISFSLYLMHVPVGGRVLNLASRYVDNELKVWLAIFIALMITILASWVFYKLVELPSQRLSKRVSYA